MSEKPKQTTITFSTTPEFKAKLQDLAQAGGVSLTAEIMNRLEFTTRWDAFGSLAALDVALSGLSPLNYAILAITAEQSQRIQENKYECVAAAKGVSRIVPYGTRQRSSRDSGGLMNALADAPPIAMPDLKSMLAAKVQELILETEASLTDEDAEILKQAHKLDEVRDYKGVDIISRLCGEWLASVDDFMNSDAVSIEAQRKRARFLRLGDLLSMIAYTLLDFLVFMFHERRSGVAIDNLVSLGVGANVSVLSEEYQPIIRQLVDEIDQETSKVALSLEPGSKVAFKIWGAVRDLREKVAASE